MISYAASDDNPKSFLGCSEIFVAFVAHKLSDEALRHTITFGIGLHHAGLSSFDRETVEKMFLKGEIKVVVATATVSSSFILFLEDSSKIDLTTFLIFCILQLAWGVNLPAHLVIVKGTFAFLTPCCNKK
jgi:activating signal cointegrator complex subunit 3